MSEDTAVMSTEERLIYMANQIARNLAAQGGDEAIGMVAEHIRNFWDPSMRRRIIALANERRDSLSPIAAAAVDRVAAP